MAFQITVENATRSFPCRADQSVLAAMRAAFLLSIQTGCRSGGCGICRVQVLEGEYETGTMSTAEISPADRQRGIVLACQLFPRTDLRIKAMPRVIPGNRFGAATVQSMSPNPGALIPGFQP